MQKVLSNLGEEGSHFCYSHMDSFWAGDKAVTKKAFYEFNTVTFTLNLN